jgi:hypothetical protein
MYQVGSPMYNKWVKFQINKVLLGFRKFLVYLAKFFGIFFVLYNRKLCKNFYKVGIFILTRYLAISLFLFIVFDYLMGFREINLLKLIAVSSIPLFLYVKAIPTRLNYFYYVLIILFEFYLLL